MSLITRITRLLKADMHGILDTLEEPEVVLKQAVREMQEEIETSHRQLKSLEKQQEHLDKKAGEIHSQVRELEQQIGFCFKENNEALAKSRIRKKMELTRCKKILTGNRERVGEEKTELQKELVERQDKLQSIVDKLLLFGEQKSENLSGAANEGEAVTDHIGVSEEDVEIAFLHERQQWSQSNSSTGE